MKRSAKAVFPGVKKPAMSNEKMSGNLIQEIKDSEKTAAEMIEKAGKLAAERLRRVSQDYEKKMAELEIRFKQDKRNTIKKVLKDASQKKERRKEEIDNEINLIEQRAKERREKALVLVMQRIMD